MQSGAPLALGIDFGTTNSVVAMAYANGRVESMVWPTVVGPIDTFRTALLFWREGRAKLGHTAGPYAIERAIAPEGEQRFIQSIKTHLASRLFSETRLYGERFTIERLVSTFLGHLLQGLVWENAGTLAVSSGRPVVFAGESPDEELAVTRLKSAYVEAGLPQVELAYEPLGAAYWYARKLARDETVLVADFGGGTSDFSVLRFSCEKGCVATEALAHSGVGIAGDTFDYRIIDHIVAPKLGKGTLYRSFEKLLPLPAYFHAAFAQWHQLSWLKSSQTLGELRRLAAASEVPRMIEDLITIIEMDLGFDLYRAVGEVKAELSHKEGARFRFNKEGIEIDVEFERKDFEAWIATDLQTIEAAMEKAIEGAGLANKDIDAVFMTGGTSYVPAVRRLFVERFGEKRIHVGDAFQSVASGLALLAADRAGKG